MFKKVLIANRGEIALRILRACVEMGIKPVVVYSQADAQSLPVKAALDAGGEAVCIGPAASAESYLKFANIISAAVTHGCEAIHPGYGFLSENADFVQACKDNDVEFIGPSAATINLAGNKSNAKKTMSEAGVPIIPGSKAVIQSIEEARAVVNAIGYPILFKAAAGGGGKGMREVHDKDELAGAYQAAANEALSAFGNGDVYIERLIKRPRHIEVQVMADKFGNRMALYERDCSIQRRHQKLLEEAPAPSIAPKLRSQLEEVALKAAAAVNYTSVGTVEFLYDRDDPQERFYFMEMNTRVQVEHPVTEVVSGFDIIKSQIALAAGYKLSELPYTKPEQPFGHAIELRINAEDPAKDFCPSPGTITALQWPTGPGIRVDSAIYCGYTVPPYYDSMLAKLIVWGANRDEAIRRARRALNDIVISGVATTISLQRDILHNKAFTSANLATDFMEREFA